MFTNLGGKLMMMAKILCWLGIVASVIAGIVMLATSRGNAGMIVGGILVIVIGSLVSWIGSWAMYGLGEVVKEAEQLR